MRIFLALVTIGTVLAAAEQFVRHDTEARQLPSEFVCVRLVQMKGVDLRTFQFDWDLTWHVFFLNPDGAIYGRYGTRAGARNNQMTHISLDSFKRAMQRSLELHRAYPANKTALAGKRGPEPEYRFAETAPDLVKLAGATTSRNCIHCHMAGEALLKARRARGTLSAADIWSFPLPENVGLRMDLEDDLRVRSVAPGSAAARSGIAAGDWRP